MEQHTGGKIWCESEGEGQGCTFVIDLPALDASQMPSEEARWMHSTEMVPRSPRSSVTPVQMSPRSGLASPEPHFVSRTASKDINSQRGMLPALARPLAHPLPQGMHVLVVDDSDMNRKVSGVCCPAWKPGSCLTSRRPTSHKFSLTRAQMVARLLQREGHTVSEAVDGVVAVSMVSRTLLDRASAKPINASAALERSDSKEGGESSSKRSAPGLTPFDVVLMDGNMPRWVPLYSPYSPYIAPI